MREVGRDVHIYGKGFERAIALTPVNLLSWELRTGPNWKSMCRVKAEEVFGAMVTCGHEDVFLARQMRGKGGRKTG